MAFEIPRQFYDFLVSVDQPPKEESFILKAAKAFMMNDVCHHADLIGFDTADCAKGLERACTCPGIRCTRLMFQVPYPVVESPHS